MRGGNSSRWATKASVSAPTTPATVLADNTPNSSVPTATPSSPAGISRRNRCGSRSRYRRWMPATSAASSTGSMMPAACGTLTAIAISGVASDPKPEAKPLLARPINSTLGIARA